MAEIQHDEKGGPTFRRRKGFRITLCLSLCRNHGSIPSVRSTHGGAPFQSLFGLGRGQLKQRYLYGIASLLRFQNKAVSLVKIDEVGCRGAIEFLIDDGLIDYIGVQALVRLAWLRTRQFQVVAKFGEEQGVVCPLGSLRSLPAMNETLRV